MQYSCIERNQTMKYTPSQQQAIDASVNLLTEVSELNSKIIQLGKDYDHLISGGAGHSDKFTLRRMIVDAKLKRDVLRGVISTLPTEDTIRREVEAQEAGIPLIGSDVNHMAVRQVLESELNGRSKTYPRRCKVIEWCNDQGVTSGSMEEATCAMVRYYIGDTEELSLTQAAVQFNKLEAIK